MAGSHAVSLLPLRSLQRRGSGARAAFSFCSAFRQREKGFVGSGAASAQVQQARQAAQRCWNSAGELVRLQCAAAQRNDLV